jgi:UDP-N-acetylmuramoyl-tripeptide--D-alanyl-D-alanine ligase
MSDSSPTPKTRFVDWAVGAMNGTRLGSAEPAGATFVGIATDSRAVKPGRLFFALPGERVDGFDFCATAVASGAAGVVVPSARGIPAGCENAIVIGVPDVRRALGDLARAVRARFKGRVVGVTGSNGKTTTKELIAAALAIGGSVLRTQGNFNTDIGLPITVLDASEDEAFWVLEMAMRGRGEIAYLADIAKPHIGVVTNVAGAHLERLGSLAEVARAKGEIFHGLAEGGLAVLPADEPLLEAEASHLPEERKARFAPAEQRPDHALVRILECIPAGEYGSVLRFSVGSLPVIVRLPLAGEHNARNAAAALTVAALVGLPILDAAKALETATLPPHRSALHVIGGRKIMDDCYNANPTSMMAALQTLAASAGNSTAAFAILGDMLEIGAEAESAHEEIGRAVARLRFAGLATVGDLAGSMAAGARAAGLADGRVLATRDPADAAAAIAAWSKPGDWVLVKASRGMRLERALEALQHKLGI